MAKDTVTCRYGVTYTYEAKGSKGSRERLKSLLSTGCCFVCHNRNCKEPKNERLEECDHTKNDLLKCNLFTKDPYCIRKQLWTDVKFS